MSMPATITLVVLRYLAEEDATASDVGAMLRNRGIWTSGKRGVANGGGGDYPAQMLLGRMRKLGWVRVRHARGDASSVWQLTVEGRKQAA